MQRFDARNWGHNLARSGILAVSSTSVDRRNSRLGGNGAGIQTANRYFKLLKKPNGHA